MHLTMNCHNDPAYEILFDDLIQEVFGFCPDWLGIAPEWQAADPVEQPFYIRGDWQLPEHFRFPALSET